MPILDNPKHEMFAQGLAIGLVPEAAYERAGFKPHRQNAHRLMTNENILERVKELQSRAANGVVISRQKVLEELARIAFVDAGDAYVKASDKRTALMDIAKLEGWVVERSERGAPGEFDDLDADRLRAKIAETLGLGSAIDREKMN